VKDDSPQPKPGIGWFFVLAELRADGFPSKELLEYARLSGGHKPPEVVDFLAGLGSGEIIRPRGRAAISQFEREVIGDYVRGVLAEIHADLRAARKAGEHFSGSPLDAAMEVTSEKLLQEGMEYSVETIRDIRLKRKGW
jgi:hypothetical protein